MIHFIVHQDGDSVGTVVVEGVASGDTLTGWVMEEDRLIEIRALADIPIGHKVCIQALEENATVIKYGVDIGKTIAPIEAGSYLHVHNVKTKRW